VCYGDRCPSPGQSSDGFLYLLFRLSIDGACCLVEDEDSRVAEYGAGDRNTLFFAAGEAVASLTDVSVVAIRLGEDEVVRIGSLGSSQNLIDGGFGPGVDDVVEYGATEEESLLQDDADLAAEVDVFYVTHVDAVYQDAALVHVVEAAEQVDERALAGAGAAHKPYHLVGLYLYAHLLDDGVEGVVSERDIVKFDGTLHCRHCGRVGGILYLRLGVDDIEDALGCGKGAGHVLEHASKHEDGAIEVAQIRLEREYCTGRGDFAFEEEITTEEPHGDAAEVDEPVEGGMILTPPGLELDAGVAVVDAAAVKLVDLDGFLTKSLDDPGAGERIADKGGEPLPLVHEVVPEAVNFGEYLLEEGHCEDQRNKYAQCELPVHYEQDGAHAYQHQGVLQDHRQEIDEKLPQFVCILIHTGHQSTGLVLVEVGKGKLLELLIDGRTDLVGGAMSGLTGEPAAQSFKEEPYGVGQEYGEHHQREVPGVIEDVRGGFDPEEIQYVLWQPLQVCVGIRWNCRIKDFVNKHLVHIRRQQSEQSTRYHGQKDADHVFPVGLEELEDGDQGLSLVRTARALVELLGNWSAALAAHFSCAGAVGWAERLALYDIVYVVSGLPELGVAGVRIRDDVVELLLYLGAEGS